MKPLSAKVSSIAPSATIAIAEQAKQMQGQGIDVISLSIGEPDFDTPAHIRAACIAALERGETHYAPSSGIPELVRAVSDKITHENGFAAAPGEVMITCGAKDAICKAMEAVLNPRDEVILLDPCWVSYDPDVRLAGGVPVHAGLEEGTFQVADSLVEKITPRTKMVVVNSPSNPSGVVLDTGSLRLVADICEDHDLYLLSDEIYEKLVYGKVHISPASIDAMKERTITINGFSKAYAMTGWRIGYAVAPEEIIRLMLRVQQHSVTSPNTFAMWGALAALTGDQGCVEDMRRMFEERRGYVISALAGMGFETAPADGAFYAFVKVAGDDVAVARDWLNSAHVAVTPGTAFCAPGWLRISYAASMERLEEALKRIRALI